MTLILGYLICAVVLSVAVGLCVSFVQEAVEHQQRAMARLKRPSAPTIRVQFHGERTLRMEEFEQAMLTQAHRALAQKGPRT